MGSDEGSPSRERYDQGILMLIVLLLVDSLFFGCVSSDLVIFMSLLSLESVARLIAGFLAAKPEESDEVEEEEDLSDSEEDDECSVLKRDYAEKMKAMATVHQYPIKASQKQQHPIMEKLSHMVQWPMDMADLLSSRFSGSETT